jgi:hypothetical protein
MKYLSTLLALCINTSIQLHAMDSDVEISNDVRFEIDEPTLVVRKHVIKSKPVLKGMNWVTFLDKLTHISKPSRAISNYQNQFVTEEMTFDSANKWALENVAKLSFFDARGFLNTAFAPEERDKLLAHKNTASDPYILFIYLIPDIQKKILAYLDIKSKAAQNKFLAMHTSRAFRYHAAYEQRGILPINLYFSLATLKQDDFLEIVACNHKPVFDETELPQIPNHLLEAPEYATIMTKKITITKDVLWTHGIIKEERTTTLKELCTPVGKPVEETAAPPSKKQKLLSVEPVGNDSPTVTALSRAKTQSRSNDYTSQPFHHE